MKPKFGDVLIREHMDGGYEVVDALTFAHLSGHISTLNDALTIARLKGGRIWQQTVDRRGRPISEPALFQPT